MRNESGDLCRVEGQALDDRYFNRAVFEAIVRPLASSLAGKIRIDERGVWIESAMAAGSTVEEENVLLWHPRIEVWEPGMPSPDEVPSLPFPFTPAQLAAYMVAGCGYWLQEFYGDLEDCLEDDALNRLGDRGVVAKAALTAAYEAYRIADSAVVRQDRRLWKRCRVLCKWFDRCNARANRRERLYEAGISGDEYFARRARAKESVSNLWEQCREAQAERDKDGARWRKEIVRGLLTRELAKAPRPSSAFSEQLRPVQMHTTGGRRDLLTPVIERAQQACANQWDTAEVFAQLERLARRSEPPPPLSNTNSGGVRYLDGGQTKVFTKKALGDRLKRARERQAGIAKPR